MQILLQDAPELDQHGEKLQNGFSESFLYADISERKELHLSLRPRKWGSKYLDTLQQVSTLSASRAWKQREDTSKLKV